MWIESGGRLARNNFRRLLFSTFLLGDVRPGLVVDRFSTLCAIISPLPKYRGIRKSDSRARSSFDAWILYKLTDSLYFSMVGVSAKCFGNVVYDMDGISGVIEIIFELPAIVKMSVSLAGRNEKYGKLWIVRNRLFKIGVLIPMLLDSSSESTTPPASALSLAVDGVFVVIIGTGRKINSFDFSLPSNDLPTCPLAPCWSSSEFNSIPAWKMEKNERQKCNKSFWDGFSG